MLMTLEMTAEFNTVDHGTLLSHLQHRVGIKGVALMLMKSYLTDRSFPVPQGLIFGLLFFSLFMLPLGSFHQIRILSKVIFIFK